MATVTLEEVRSTFGLMSPIRHTKICDVLSRADVQEARTKRRSFLQSLCRGCQKYCTFKRPPQTLDEEIPHMLTLG